MSAAADAYWAAVPLGRGVRVVKRDANGLAALEKPEGVLSHPNSVRDQPRSLVMAAYDEDEECFQWTGADGAPARLWLVNRLDSATSGLILAAADGALAKEARGQFQKRQVRKIYQTIVFGRPRQGSEEWTDILSVRRGAARVRASSGAGNIPAVCSMTLDRTWVDADRFSLLRLEPHTGRSHQLRVQCAKRGLPIVGDQTYGIFARNRKLAKSGKPKRLFLHSYSVSLAYVLGGRSHEFSAVSALPADFGLLG